MPDVGVILIGKRVQNILGPLDSFISGNGGCGALINPLVTIQKRKGLTSTYAPLGRDFILFKLGKSAQRVEEYESSRE